MQVVLEYWLLMDDDDDDDNDTSYSLGLRRDPPQNLGALSASPRVGKFLPSMV